MGSARNVLFIMCDQLRYDYLSCYGHPHLETPNLDALAARGVRFDRAYVQSPMCGPSRMSFYTGRYVASHGVSWNGFPLKVGERTLGDHLRPLGVRTAVCGKTHMKADLEGMARLGIDPKSAIGIQLAECGFEPYERDDGLHPDGPYDPEPRYNDYLRARGWDDPNPWQNVANSGVGPDGELRSGWFLSNAGSAARVAEPDSETPYMTRRAMQFIAETGDYPWCLHLSYIKPHWPYIAPAPYHAIYGPDSFLPPLRCERERDDPHPVYAHYMRERFSQAFSRDEVRETVLGTYMGLIKQIDDQLGVLFDFLEARRLFENTMVVFTSDHGDYLGDHWLGEKELLHEPSVRVPMIVYDPRPEAAATRGTASDALVESIDLVPTFLDFYGAARKPHILEGRSLQPLLHGIDGPSRRYVISQYDYSLRRARIELGVRPSAAQLYMVFDGRWKYVFAEGFRPMLYDLETDPNEFEDLGASRHTEAERARLEGALFQWARRVSQRTTISDEQIRQHTGTDAKAGILIGYWDSNELSA